MEKLHAWLQTQFDESKEEPNSGLGEAIRYLLKHWERLTLFLRQAGAPLDNNIAERGLKKAILHRKNSLFYKTQNGAQVGDLFMSLIHTCELCDANPLDYLTALQKHSAELARNQLGLDAVELRRHTGASRRYSGCRVGIPFWSMIIPLAGNYRFWRTIHLLRSGSRTGIFGIKIGQGSWPGVSCCLSLSTYSERL